MPLLFVFPCLLPLLFPCSSLGVPLVFHWFAVHVAFIFHWLWFSFRFSSTSVLIFTLFPNLQLLFLWLPGLPFVLAFLWSFCFMPHLPRISCDIRLTHPRPACPHAATDSSSTDSFDRQELTAVTVRNLRKLVAGPAQLSQASQFGLSQFSWLREPQASACPASGSLKVWPITACCPAIRGAVMSRSQWPDQWPEQGQDWTRTGTSKPALLMPWMKEIPPNRKLDHSNSQGCYWLGVNTACFHFLGHDISQQHA